MGLLWYPDNLTFCFKDEDMVFQSTLLLTLKDIK